jgi:curved DNA-binding protein
MGNYGPYGGWSWDLLIKVMVKPSQNFVRKWDNIVSEIFIDPYEAVLWGEREILHPSGKIKIKIPKGVQAGDTIRVSWKWFVKWGFLSSKWDFLVIPKIQIPKKLTKEQEKLWKKLQDISKAK